MDEVARLVTLYDLIDDCLSCLADIRGETSGGIGVVKKGSSTGESTDVPSDRAVFRWLLSA
jgi:hypothetical protein